MKYKIIAVDFDGTLCSNKYPEIGEPNGVLINYLNHQKTGGDVKVILWTCRVGDRLTEAVEWSKEQGLTFDEVNKNIPEIIEDFGSDSRKIFAHQYIDDRNFFAIGLPYLEWLPSFDSSREELATFRSQLDVSKNPVINTEKAFTERLKSDSWLWGHHEK